MAGVDSDAAGAVVVVLAGGHALRQRDRQVVEAAFVRERLEFDLQEFGKGFDFGAGQIKVAIPELGHDLHAAGGVLCGDVAQLDRAVRIDVGAKKRQPPRH